MRSEGGKVLQIHPASPFSLDNFRSWKSLPMGHFQSVGRKTGGVPVAFFPLYPTFSEVSGRQDELPKGQDYSKDQPQLKHSNKALIIKTPLHNY